MLFYFDGADPDVFARTTKRNVGDIDVSSATDFTLPYDSFAESYTLNVDEVFNLFTDAGGTVTLSAAGTTSFGGFNTALSGARCIGG